MIAMMIFPRADFFGEVRATLAGMVPGVSVIAWASLSAIGDILHESARPSTYRVYARGLQPVSHLNRCFLVSRAAGGILTRQSRSTTSERRSASPSDQA